MLAQRNRYEIATLVMLSVTIIVSVAGVIIAAQDVAVSTKILDLTNKLFEHETKPAQLVFEATAKGTNMILLEQGKTFHISHTHQIEEYHIEVTVWNIGLQNAENVVVGVRLDPQDSNLYDSFNHKRCRNYDCFDFPFNPVRFRAIEPNGFYSMRTSLNLFTSDIKSMNGTVDLVVFVSYFNSKNEQNLEERYQIIVD